MRKLHTQEIHRLTTEEFREASKTPLIVVMDSVRSLYNVGAVFRTADAFRIEAIYLCGITACPPSNEIHKTALGAEDSVAWRYFPDTAQAIDTLHHDGYTVCAVEQAEGSTSLDSLTVYPAKRYAIVMGNEVKGVRQDVVDSADACIEIPQWGTKHSLNVSCAASIVMWEFARKLTENL